MACAQKKYLKHVFHYLIRFIKKEFYLMHMCALSSIHTYIRLLSINLITTSFTVPCVLPGNIRVVQTCTIAFRMDMSGR